MTAISKDDVLAALRKVRGPDLKADVVTSGLVSDIVVAGKDVMFALTIDPARAEELEPMRKAAETAVARIARHRQGHGGAHRQEKARRRAMAAMPARRPGRQPPLRIATPPAGANWAACRG